MDWQDCGFPEETATPTKMALTALLIPTFTQLLHALSAWLDKAAETERAASRSPDALLSKRLAPDMYPLSSQVRFACFQAQEAAYRLRGLDLPEQLHAMRRDGRTTNGQPSPLGEVQICITRTLAVLATLGPNALDEGAQRQVALALPDGIIFDMTGEQYARDWALPQFYFHLTAAYAVLRNQGIALGKQDYVPHMFGYLRPGTLPSQA